MPLPPRRHEIIPGMRVQIIEKQNQRSGLLSEGVVARLLTKSSVHPHGIKVMLTDGRVGRVQAILPVENGTNGQSLNLPKDSENGPTNHLTR